MAFTLCFCKLLWFQVTLSLSLCGIWSTHTSSSIWSAVSVHAVLCLYLRFLSFFSHLLWISNVNFFILLGFLTTIVVQHCAFSLIYGDFKQITKNEQHFCIFFVWKFVWFIVLFCAEIISRERNRIISWNRSKCE